MVEDDLWQKYVASKDTNIQNTRTWDICAMMRGQVSSPAAIQHKPHTFRVILKRKEMTLRAYIHPQIMALCVGLEPK